LTALFINILNVNFLLPAQLFGTHCLMTFRICSVLLTFSDTPYMHYCSHSISVSSTLEVFCDNMLYKFTFFTSDIGLLAVRKIDVKTFVYWYCYIHVLWCTTQPVLF